MNILMDILKVILPTTITGFITFIVTKYKCYSNKPIDKLQIAYDRVYYPIYRMIRNEDDHATIILKSSVYLNKYDKYVDRSTKVAFNYLKDNPDLKHAYGNFENNIYAINTKLRRQIGYLEPNTITVLKYLSPSEKRVLRICFEMLICYLAILGAMFFTHGYVYNILCFVFALSFVFLVFELIVLVLLKLLKSILDYIKMQVNKQ